MKVKLPTVVGIPDSNPEDNESVRPGGRIPVDTAKLYDPVPPLAVIVWAYAWDFAPLGKIDGLSVIVGQQSQLVCLALLSTTIVSASKTKLMIANSETSRFNDI